MKLLSGKPVAEKMKEEVKKDVEVLKLLTGRAPILRIISIGDDPASHTYVKGKIKDCLECGIKPVVYTNDQAHYEDYLILKAESHNFYEKAKCFKIDMHLNLKNTYNDLIFIKSLSDQNHIDTDGLIVQLPCPFDFHMIQKHIDPNTDADCFTNENIIKMYMGEHENSVIPATPLGILEILKYYDIPVKGKHIVIVGRSHLVGKPLATLMTQMNGTITLCHSYTENLSEITRTADILVSAVGKIDMITDGMIKEGAVCIDVGINRKEDGSLCGDMNLSAVEKVASCYTPVPGGVGLTTRAALLKNVVTLAQNRIKRTLEDTALFRGE